MLDKVLTKIARKKLTTNALDELNDKLFFKHCQRIGAVKKCGKNGYSIDLDKVEVSNMKTELLFGLIMFPGIAIVEHLLGNTNR